MKKAIVLVLSIFVAGISSCSSVKNNPDTNLITLRGTVEEMGMTSFQYGSHKIKTADMTYALRSAKIPLSDYTDKQVTLKGTKVSGYPMEGGPELIEVVEISVE